jgi:hypothetical protein
MTGVARKGRAVPAPLTRGNTPPGAPCLWWPRRPGGCHAGPRRPPRDEVVLRAVSDNYFKPFVFHLPPS